ncbi:MAG TPA: hypothetical protein VFH29_03985, partial [Anaerolineales bacterium]|nr:hypothetical protein [Anaerolineales bacterium]
MKSRSRLLVLALVVTVGIGLGLAYGRLVAPVEYVDTDPSSLRVDYRSDYVLMVAERYDADHDVLGALRRLSVLGAQSPDLLCAEALQFGQSTAYAPHDLELLQLLLRAMQEQ